MPDIQDNPGLTIAREAMQRFRRVSTLPEVALRIVEKAGHTDCDAGELADLFREDPALCAMLLKVANSPFYGLRHQVACVTHASNLLGRRALRGVAIAASVGRLFRGKDSFPGYSIRALWRHLVGVAAATRFLCGRFNVTDPDEAFTAGLIHDLGLVVMMEYDRSRFGKLIKTMSAGDAWSWTEEESKIFGATHQDFGRAFAETLGLPGSMLEVAARHHEPGSGNKITLTVLVQGAHALVEAHDHGLLKAPAADPVVERALQILEIDEHSLENIREAFHEELAKIHSVF